MSRFVQAPRRPEDGPVKVTRPDAGFVLVSVVSAGQEETILMSEHNAARVFALLGFVLADGGPSLLTTPALGISL